MTDDTRPSPEPPEPNGATLSDDVPIADSGLATESARLSSAETVNEDPDDASVAAADRAAANTPGGRNADIDRLLGDDSPR